MQDLYIELPKPQTAFLTCPLHSSSIILPVYSVLTLRLDCSLPREGLRVWSLDNIPIIPLLELGKTHVLHSLNESVSMLSTINMAKLNISRLDFQVKWLNDTVKFVKNSTKTMLWGGPEPVISEIEICQTILNTFSIISILLM